MSPGGGRRVARWARGVAALLLSASAGAVGMASLMAGPASAAAAAPASCKVLVPCAPSGSISGSPSASGGSITVIWTPSGNTPVDAGSTTLTIAWTPTTTIPLGAPFPSASSSTPPGNCARDASTGHLACTYTWPSDLMVNGYVLNGTYKLSAAADSCLIVGSVDCSPLSTATQTLAVANPPQAPTGVKATVAANGSSVTISWAPNPEPDIVGYQVFRADGTLACQVAATSPNPTSYSCTDLPTTDGRYSYTVVARRYGASYSTAVKDEPGGPASAATTSVTVTGTTVNSTTTTVSGSPPTTATLGPVGFTAVPKPSKTAPKAGGTGKAAFPATPRSVTAPPTTDGGGFAAVLPYGQRSSPATTTDPAAISVPAAPHKGQSSVATIAVVGAGLLIAVIALHGLWLRAEVRRSGTLEAIDPEA